MKLKSWFFVVITVIYVTGCATTTNEMRGYIGKTIEDVVVDYGPPATYFDMPDGRRAFQWEKTRSFTAPVVVQSYGNARSHSTGSATATQFSPNMARVNGSVNTNTYGNSTAVVSGGNTASWECRYTFYGGFDPRRDAWIIIGYETPRQRCQ